jgi:hypothetical protein
MANKIKPGNRPKTFKEINVNVTLPDGEAGILPVTFKYKTKKEFGAWQDALLDESKMEKSVREEFSWETFYEEAGDRTAEVLLDVVDSWGLDVELSKASLLEIEADCGAGVFPALLDAFGKACREGRLGN